MKIKSIKLKNFRRFKDLTIELPETARLVVMIGPNGSGKSSVFDALHRYKSLAGEVPEHRLTDSYYVKFDESGQITVNFKEPDVHFHAVSPETPKEWRECVHVRTAYRNDSRISKAGRTYQSSFRNRISRMSENDEAVEANYSELLSLWIKRSSNSEISSKTIGDLQSEIYGQLRDALKELFRDPQLFLTNLGTPSIDKIFQFNKGISHGFSYENLSGGEKAALDLLLDIIIVKAKFNDTVFCIDEPEAHIHTKLQGPLLEQLYKLIPDNSQLWIATHSAGMVRKAQDLWHEDQDSVVFLDFGGHDFDVPVTLTPVTPNPDFWERTYEVALGDLAELVITGRTVFCEGEGFDEECYKNIFKKQYPNIHFTSLGARENVVKSVTAANLAIGKIAESVNVIGIVDRDQATDDEIERETAKGIRTLSRKSIESYLLDDEVLTKLCEEHGKQDKIQDLLTAKTEALNKRTIVTKSKTHDDLKPIAQDMHNAANGIIDSVSLGNKKESFMIDILAKLIQPGMAVYDELHKDIFGE